MSGELAAFLADPAAQQAWRVERDALIALLETESGERAAARRASTRARLAGLPGSALAAALESVHGEPAGLGVWGADDPADDPADGSAGDPADGAAADAAADRGTGPTAVAGVEDRAEVLVAAVAAGRRLEGWAVWEQLCGIAGLLARWTPAGGAAGARDAWEGRGRAVEVGELAEACVVAEVALAAGISEHAAGRRLDAAVALIVEGRLPVTAALAGQGLVDWPRIQLVVSRTRDLDPAGARAVEARVGDAIASAGYQRLRDALDRAVAAVDAEAARRRADTARRDRRVRLRAG
ncbi:MAG: hypothetical protein ACKVZ6_13370, partial [Kineosporiaceae bacterium]